MRGFKASRMGVPLARMKCMLRSSQWILNRGYRYSGIAQVNDDTAKRSPKADLRQQIAEGLLYTHSRLNCNTRRTMDAASFLYALVELLEEKGLISIEELDRRKEVVAERLAEQARRDGNGALFLDPECDKYAFEQSVEIDCARRIPVCKAACCRLSFALSRQDVREGIVRWNLGQPYLIDQGADGYCTHSEPGTRSCTIYGQRPVPCRGYDCRNDERIWSDFSQMIPNPSIERPDWPHCLVGEERERTP